ncbi:UDP-2,4-diacetamido-2,4,6-trideoxy-beta-L-altropyranose hydrolase [Bradyrhizobium japonicum]|uniref:UDP-2,4-diacetamido-2,4, 6-trideoxy-beta-L-altropyranose hydrolase n=1 Tax=Bradyrhizobium japonicum TaxID=375 RepID=A0ABV2RSZ7_BRAJP|nr:UDP-2,4-diacetamido-2,4,6-trideoxy-beta-L-altropyranose hydrolase [Bradyrhizobium japonicum]UQD70207.1 UDP-2,4-diacetamido-2,4,6-trideoxy-beta-L-altropyranose hydrolase [Bradyrhizobium japonicum]WLB16835.1 UDP-2,4-diacetamido-2,4,6-trideoxy-beta-L-altropyranose hydrolase [Bradyrhizobium japonicum]
MLIVFRADADPATGGGHVMRCLTLATEMQQRGADVLFVCAPGTADTVPALTHCGIRWLEADQHDWNTDLADGGLAGTRIDLIVIDSYRLGEAFERSLRRHGCPILVIDDAPVRPHDCDLLVDTTLGRNADDYAGLIPQHCRVIAGSPYALLRSAFGELRAVSLARRRATFEPASIYVSLGLTDVGGQTADIARYLANAGTYSRIIVVIGPTASSLDEVVALGEESTRVQVHVDPPEIAELMANADIAIGTPGTSSWERCCLGLPSIQLVVADNQRENARALEQAGAARIVPPGCDVPDTIARILAELARQPDELARMSRQAAKVCDGAGAQRVGEAIDALVQQERTGQLTLRRATADDARRLWFWRNDPGARAMSGDSRAVPWDAHSKWFNNRIADANTLIFIIQAEGRPCGNVRFHIELTGTAGVSIAMARNVRGRGYGATALVLACQEAFGRGFCERIEARVKRENLASQKIFLKAGFVLAGQEAEFLVYQLSLRAASEGNN